MNVTINTDASFSNKHKVGAYAFWITSDVGRIMHSGMLKEAANSEDAEMKCIYNAITVFLRSNMQM